MRRRAAFLLPLFSTLLFPAAASAQLHWDAAAQLGVNKRFLFERPPGGDDAGFGPAAQLSAHVALMPLVRVGAYVGYEISPLGDPAAARDIGSAGLRAKVMLPWVRDKMRAWIFLGFGYAIVHARPYSTSIVIDPPARAPERRDVEVLEGRGGFLEVPLGVGGSYKLSKPLEVFAELGVRLGFAHHGSAYDVGPQVVVPGDVNQNLLPSGTDSFGLGLSVGILLDL